MSPGFGIRDGQMKRPVNRAFPQVFICEHFCTLGAVCKLLTPHQECPPDADADADADVYSGASTRNNNHFWTPRN